MILKMLFTRCADITTSAEYAEFGPFYSGVVGAIEEVVKLSV